MQLGHGVQSEDSETRFIDRGTDGVDITLGHNHFNVCHTDVKLLYTLILYNGKKALPYHIYLHAVLM